LIGGAGFSQSSKRGKREAEERKKEGKEDATKKSGMYLHGGIGYGDCWRSWMMSRTWDSARSFWPE